MNDPIETLVELHGCTPGQRALFHASVSIGQPIPLVHVHQPTADALREPQRLWNDLDAFERERLRSRIASMRASSETPLEEQFDLADHAQRLPRRWQRVLTETVQRERIGVEVGDPRLGQVIRSLALSGAPRLGKTHIPVALAGLIELAENERASRLVALGAVMLKTGGATLDARRTARFLRFATDSEREVGETLSGFEPSSEWVVRFRELLVALADHEPRERLRRMGLYLVTLSCAQQLSKQAITQLQTDMNPEIAGLIDSYADSIRRSSRRGLTHEAHEIMTRIGEASSE